MYKRSKEIEACRRKGGQRKTAAYWAGENQRTG